MTNALNLYMKNLQRVNDLGAIYSEIIRLAPTLTTQAEQILRSQFVLIVSAFDTFIHDVVRIGIVQEYQGTRVRSNVLGQFNIPYGDLRNLESQPPLMKLPTLDCIIRTINAKDSYQAPKSVEYALNLIGINNLWTQVAPRMGMTSTNVKNKLSIVVRRRNQIAHESDIEPTTGSQRILYKTDVDDVISFISDLVNSIYALV